MLTVYNYHEVSSAFGAGITTSETFEGLEPCDGKLSRTVLRRELGCKAQLLSGVNILGCKSPKEELYLVNIKTFLEFK
jgi:hypothetical protein